MDFKELLITVAQHHIENLILLWLDVLNLELQVTVCFHPIVFMHIFKLCIKKKLCKNAIKLKKDKTKKKCRRIFELD